MPLSVNIRTYEDVRAILDRALLSDRGVLVTRPSAGSALHLRQRCYKLRALDRLENQKLYKESDPMYGNSPYDHLTIDCVENMVYVRKVSAEMFKIEDIPEEEELKA